ncbi:hypothetical protein RKE29_15925 [Streptomyces sp. B1866]|uniref:DUF7224 domain-containing protein n=1 Tax=Streptomyces sp. B1866 TaxID=3075431 RepID=UPI00288D287D|nr:hypothetical protein [Streptomyces sp. B1866]MDT3398111.1 hypothetical protein [Streptomyces sp. B1866]
MRWRTALRVSIAPRIGLLLIPWLLAYRGKMTDWITDGYWESVTAQSTFLLGYTAPAVAACGAWEAVRVRQSQVLQRAPARSATAVALSALVPTFVLGGLSVLLAVALFAPQAMGYPGGPSPAVIGLALLVVVAHTAVGYAVGLTLPGILAVPTAMVGSFVWMAYPSAMEVFWVRQLNGHNLTECCALDEVVAPRSLLAPALVAVGMVAAAWIWTVRGRFSRPALLLAPAVLAAAVVAGAVVAEPLGYRAAVPRSTALRTCGDTVPRICLWPEQRRAAADITAWATQARQRLAAAGLRTPGSISVTSVSPTQDQVRSLLALSLVPNDIPPCAADTQWPGYAAVGPVSAWLSLTAGADPRAVAGRYPREEVRIAQQVLAAPRKAQLSWFLRNARTFGRCDQSPDLNPAHYQAAPAARRAVR